jgi:2,2-dialkylglycine decarboxylase (pyruvate)
MARNVRNSLDLWEKYGKHVLMAMPYADNLIGDADGSTLRDIDGNQILDFAAGQFCSILGNNHPKYLEKIVSQMQRVAHTGTQFLSPIVLEAAAKFAGVAPNPLSKSLFLSTGTEANECAISLARAYTGKRGVIGFNRGYYGLSSATKSLTSIFSPGDKHGSGPRVPESFHFLAPHCFHCPVKSTYPACDLLCLKSSMEAALARDSDIAAIVVEPVFSAGGLFVPPPGYLKQLQALAHDLGALLIVDEAQTGFGRTGKWFGCELDGIEPDIMVVSKSSGGGFPVSGVITSDAVADKVASQGWLHLASHQSDPLPAAALAATIEIVHEENLVDKAAADGRYVMEVLRAMKEKHSILVDLRGVGLMVGLEIGATRDSSDRELCAIIVALCEQRGLHLTYTYFEPVIRLMPALTITRQEIDQAVSILDDSIRTALQGNVTLESLLPSNPYSRRLAERMQQKRSLKQIAARLYETSPKYWVNRVRNGSGK